MIEAFHIPGLAISSYQSCHWVSGVLFTKYENYFCRLQYFFIGLHLLWTGSVLFDAPQIPAGMHPFCRIPQDSAGFQWNGTGIQWNEPGFHWIVHFSHPLPTDY